MYLFTYPKHWLILDAGFNKIPVLDQNCFNKAPKLQTVNLTYNKIFHISVQGFQKLYSLKEIDLSHNTFTKFYSDMIVDCRLLFFGLVNIHLHDTEKNVFRSLELKIIHTNDYRLCCLVDSHTKCAAKKPWYVSCNDLLGSFKIKISVYCISSAIICFNVFSLVIQMFF